MIRVSPTYTVINMIKVVVVVNVLPTLLLIFFNKNIYRAIQERRKFMNNLTSRKVRHVMNRITYTHMHSPIVSNLHANESIKMNSIECTLN